MVQSETLDSHHRLRPRGAERSRCRWRLWFLPVVFREAGALYAHPMDSPVLSKPCVPGKTCMSALRSYNHHWHRCTDSNRDKQLWRLLSWPLDDTGIDGIPVRTPQHAHSWSGAWVLRDYPAEWVRHYPASRNAPSEGFAEPPPAFRHGVRIRVPKVFPALVTSA